MPANPSKLDSVGLKIVAETPHQRNLPKGRLQIKIMQCETPKAMQVLQVTPGL